MALAELRVQHVRIVAQAEIAPSPQLNIVYGENAAGKTSLLEAIDVLSRGRSFRTHLLSDLLTHGQTHLTVAAKVGSEFVPQRTLGLEKSKTGARLRVQGRAVASMAELAAELPVQVLHPDSHQLIEGAPALRRAFIDWGVFHARPGYIEVWRRYLRTLKQRNAMLKTGAPDGQISAWDGELVRAAETLDAHRAGYLQSLSPLVEEYGNRLLGTGEITLSYRRGWQNELTLRDALAASIPQDRERGFTRVGPHRAELGVKLGGYAAMHTASRGQQKLLAAAVRLAQTRLFGEQAGRACTFMVDDLSSELDRHHRMALLKALADVNVQVFISAIDPKELECHFWTDRKMFHVKQGKVAEVV